MNRRRHMIWVAAAALAVGCVGGKTTDTTPTGEVAQETTAPAPAATGGARAPGPQPKDFTLTIQVISKQCFSSAGCNVTFRVAPKYNGPPLPEGVEYLVTYEVVGGEEGPQVNSFTTQGNEATGVMEEFVSTRTSQTKLTAKATRVIVN